MNIILLILSVIAEWISSNILRNHYCKKHIATKSDLHLFNVSSSVVSALLLAGYAIATGVLKSVSPLTLLLGTAFGVSNSVCVISHMKALETGPLSYTKIMVSASMVISALSGLLIFKTETVSVWQFIGMGLMLVSFFCAVDKNNSDSGTSVKWFVLCVLAFVSCGILGVIQKAHQLSEFRDELYAFLVVAFTVGTLISAGALLFFRAKGDKITLTGREKLKPFVIFSVVCGLGIAFNNIANLYLVGVIDSIVFFPVVNGSSMLLSTLSGFILWHEKLSKKQIVGFVMGTLAVFFLCGVLR